MVECVNPLLGLLSISKHSACVYNMIDVNARPSIESSPLKNWKVKTQGLHKKNQRNPLIVRNYLSSFVLFWDIVVIGKVVGVAYPTEIIRVFFMIGGEVGRNPALDWISNILFRRHNDGKNYQHAHSIAIRKSISKIVVKSSFSQRNPTNYPDDLIHFSWIDFPSIFLDMKNCSTNGKCALLKYQAMQVCAFIIYVAL